VHVAALDLDAVDEAELDEIEAQLRVDHVRQGRLDVLNGEHANQCIGRGSCVPQLHTNSFRSIVELHEEAPVLHCSGDEDRSTQSLRRGALSRAFKLHTDLLVDLSELSFADASFMVDLAVVARRLRQQGARMLLQGAQPRVAALIAAAGLDRLPGVSVLPAVG
jgi:anti-anti-sigma factor